MLNKVFVMGRLGRDPELRSTQSGIPYTSFSLAVDRDYKDKTSGKRETDWIEVVCWRQLAEYVCKYFAKGRMMIVEGRLQVESYTDKETNTRRYRTQIVADKAYFGDSRPTASAEGNAPERNLPPEPQSSFTELEEDDALPF